MPIHFPTRIAQQAHKHRRRRGVALMLALVAIAIAVVLGVTFVAGQSTSHGIARNIDRHASARLIAESALEIGVAYVRNNETWRDDKPNGVWASGESLHGGTYELRGEDGTDEDGDGVFEGDGDLTDDASEPVTLVAIGTFDGVTHRTHVTLYPTALTGRLLMVVPNAANVGAEDQLMIDLFTSWGWSVTAMNEGSSQAVYDANAAANDVVYVSTTVNSGAIGSKLTDSPTGVVIHEAALNDDLGFNDANVVNTTTDEIEIVNNSHYITQEFGLGSLTILNKPQSIRYMDGPLTSGATLLAQQFSSNRPVVATLEKGASTSLGGPAAGRRVYLPWSVNGDPSWFNDAGRLLIRRALEWAAVPASGGGGATYAIAANGDVEIKHSGTIDSFDSRNGPYGGANVGSNAVVASETTSGGSISLENNSRIGGDVHIGPGGNPNSVVDNGGTITGQISNLDESLSLPDVPGWPSGVGSNQGDQTYTNGTSTISGNKHWDKLIIENNATVRISGDVVIRVNKDFEIKNNGDLEILPGSSLSVYVGEKILFDNNADVNKNSADPTRLRIFSRASGYEHVIGNNAEVYGIFDSTRSSLKLSNNAKFHGAAMVESIVIENNGRLSQDVNPALAEANPRLTTQSSGGGGGGGGGGAGGGLAPSGYTYTVNWNERP